VGDEHTSRFTLAASLMILLLVAATPLSPAEAARRSMHPYCTKTSHRRGCIAVPKAARRPSKAISEQGAASLAPKGTVDGGGLGSGPGVRNMAAVAWARSQLGSSIWAFRCELFAEEAFGTSDQFASARAAAAHIVLHTGRVTAAPIGALLYFAPDAVNDGFGHVAIALGGGNMISALDTVQVTNITRSRYWSNLYRGWARAPSSWPGRIPPPPGLTGPLVSSAVQITAPAFNSTVGGVVALAASAANVGGVAFDAYYATDPANSATVGWHSLGDATDQGGTWTLAWNTQGIPAQGNPRWGTVNIAAVALDGAGNQTGTRDYRRISIDNSSAPPPPTITTPPPPPVATTYTEVPGGVVNTWTNYTNAGGTPGPPLPAFQPVQVSCKVAGFQVADGDTWWYRITAGSASDAYYGSADAFYNNGASSGSLHGTPFVDPAVPNC
jgi:hypothetical protein